LSLLGMEAALPQLWGRVSTNRPVIIRETAKADVEAIAASFQITEATSLQVLRSVSKRGGLRQVANVCRHS
jgi:Mu B transposition protein, C terminal